jgi:GNAT superfamily N-acetyltransferase
MNIREAIIADITEIQNVRNSVKENILSDPSLVPDNDVKDYITRRGKGWVCVINELIVGFSIVSVTDHNIWALFIKPEFEKMGIGKQLHDVMLDWYFTQTDETVWLGTSPRTRAETFYRKMGWTETGIHGKGEIKFEMKKTTWLSARG